MPTLNAQIADQIKAVLAERNMTQTELAERLGIQRQSLNQFLSGRKSLVTSTLEKILRECDASLAIVQNK